MCSGEVEAASEPPLPEQADSWTFAPSRKSLTVAPSYVAATCVQEFSSGIWFEYFQPQAAPNQAEKPGPCVKFTPM